MRWEGSGTGCRQREREGGESGIPDHRFCAAVFGALVHRKAKQRGEVLFDDNFLMCPPAGAGVGVA